MEKLKERIGKCFIARPHTDLQSEVLNIVAAPIYLYTITGVFYHSVFYVMPYYYGNESWTLFFQKCLLALIYFEMMSNWLCIHLVDNSLKTAGKYYNVNKTNQQKETAADLDCIIVDDRNIQSRNGNSRTIPGPVSAAPPSKRSSYWSWRQCIKCDLTAPPRCHHCPFCDNCILKRDHHCFFTRRCIGFYNQRHFAVFLVWAVFGTAYSTIHFIPYLFQSFLVSYWDLFAPVSLVRACFGYSSFTTANTMFIFTFNLLFVILSSAFLHEQFDLIMLGITQFEQKKVDTNRLVISDPRRTNEKMKAVFGHNYVISLLVPFMHIVYLPHENPFEWPEHKIYRR